MQFQTLCEDLETFETLQEHIKEYIKPYWYWYILQHGKSTQFQTLCEDLETLQEDIKEHYFGTFYSKESQHRHCMMNIWKCLKHSRKTVEYFRNCLKILFDQFGARCFLHASRLFFSGSF